MRKRPRLVGQICENLRDGFEGTSSRQVQPTQTISEVSIISNAAKEPVTHLHIHKFYECKSPAGHSNLVLDEDDSSHATGTVLARTSRCLHSLSDGLRARKWIESAEKENGRLSVADVTRAIIRMLRATSTSLTRAGTLRIIDLHAAATRWSRAACLECLVEGGSCRGTMRSRRRYLDKWEERIDKCASMLGARELSETETFG